MDALDALVAPAGGQSQDTSSQPQVDPLDALVQPTKKGLPPPTENPVDIQSLVNKTKNPEETKKKLSLAKNAAPILGMSEWDIFKSAEAVSKKMYGLSDTPGSASSKLENTVKAMPLTTKINALQYQQLNEGETPERAQKIKDLQAQIPKDQVGGISKFVMDAASSLGIQVGAGLFGSVSGMQSFTQNVLSHMWYIKAIPGASEGLAKASKQSLGVSEEAINTAMGSLVGGFYGELRDLGVGVKSAKAVSGVMLAAQTALSALSAGKIPGVKQATEALAEASVKAVASGELAKSVAIQVGKGYAEQGAIAAINSATGVLLPEFAKSLSNKVDGTNLTWDQANVIWNQFATGTLQQALAMGTVHAIGATIQGTKFAAETSKMATEIDNAKEPSPNVQEGVKVASVATKADQFIDEAAKDRQRASVAKAEIAKTPVAELESVPRGTPEDIHKSVVAAMGTTDSKYETGMVLPTGEKVDFSGKKDEPAYAGKRMIEHSAVEGVPGMEGTAARDELVKSGGMRVSVPPKNRPLDQNITVELGKPPTLAQREFIEEALKDPRGIDIEMNDGKNPGGFVHYDADETQHAMQAIRSFYDGYEEPAVASDLEPEPSLSAQVEADPKVMEARAAADATPENPKLVEALDSARKEARMMATERGKVRVANERARVAAVESKHKSIDTLKSVDPDKFDKASGDAIRKIKNHFEKPKLVTGKGEPPTQVLDLAALKSALADARAAHEDVAPGIEEALNGMPSSYAKLTADQLEGLVAVVKNLDTIRKLKGKIHTAEGWIEKSNLQADAAKHIALPKGSKFGTGVNIIKNKAKAVARVMTNSFSMNGELVFGGKSTLVHKVAVQDVLNSHSDYLKESTRQQDPTRSYLRDNLKIDEQRNPLKWQKYWSDQFTEDGVTLTRNEIMDNYMSFQNENQKASILEDGTVYSSHITDEGNPANVEKIPESTYQKLFSHLEKPELDLVELAKNQLGENGQSLSDYHENRYGNPIKVEENYWPKYVKHEGATYDQDIIDIQKSNRYLSTNPDESSLISRTGAKGATYTTGFWNKFSESTDSSARIIKMGDAVSSSAKVFHDPQIADRIAKTYGGSVLKQLREDLAAEAGQHETPREIEKAMDALGNMATNLHLGVVSSLKVPWKLAGLGMRSFINNPHGFIPGVMETLIHPKKTAAAARISSSMVDEAYKHGGTVDLGQLTQYATKAGKVHAVVRKVQNMNMSLTRAGSNLGYVWDATAARHEAEYQFDRALSGKPMDPDFKAITGVSEDQVKGLTPEAKMAAVGHYQDSVIGESHAVNDPGYKIGLQKSAAGRLVTKFKTEPLKGFEQVRRLTMRFARNPTMSGAGKLFSAVAIYGVAEGALIYGINEGVNALFGVKNKSKQTLLDEEQAVNLSMIPLVGDAINEHLYLAQHPGVAAQSNAVESMAVLPLNTILDCVISIDPQYTPGQQRAASKRIFRDMKSIFNVPINLGSQNK